MQAMSESELQLVLETVTKQHESNMDMMRWLLIGVGGAGVAAISALWKFHMTAIKRIEELSSHVRGPGRATRKK
jgi:cell division GTPase FtsZ